MTPGKRVFSRFHQKYYFLIWIPLIIFSIQTVLTNYLECVLALLIGLSNNLLIYRVIPIQTHRFYIWIAEVKGERLYKCLRESTHRSHLVYSGQSPSPFAYSSGKINQWLVMSSRSHRTQWVVQPIHLLYKVKGGNNLEQSKGRVLRDQCIYIKDRWASLTRHFIRKHTFRLY